MVSSSTAPFARRLSLSSPTARRISQTKFKHSVERNALRAFVFVLILSLKKASEKIARIGAMSWNGI